MSNSDIVFITVIYGVTITAIWFYHWVQNRPGKPPIRAYPRVIERELINTLSMISERDLAAIYQVVEQVQTDAVDAAAASVGNHGICASCVGGHEFLGRLRLQIEMYREQARSDQKGEKIA